MKQKILGNCPIHERLGFGKAMLWKSRQNMNSARQYNFPTTWHQIICANNIYHKFTLLSISFTQLEYMETLPSGGQSSDTSKNSSLGTGGTRIPMERASSEFWQPVSRRYWWPKDRSSESRLHYSCLMGTSLMETWWCPVGAAWEDLWVDLVHKDCAAQVDWCLERTRIPSIYSSYLLSNYYVQKGLLQLLGYKNKTKQKSRNTWHYESW